FGLARSTDDDTKLTQGGIVGTPAYMAPEQATGEPVDHRCDLFSLGCVLYRMCTGEPPFKGANTLAILSALATVTPPPPVELNAPLPAELSDLIMSLLAKEPGQRPASAAAVRAALLAIECGTAAPAPVPATQPAPRARQDDRGDVTEIVTAPKQPVAPAGRGAPTYPFQGYVLCPFCFKTRAVDRWAPRCVRVTVTGFFGPRGLLR
ncbi:MAG TPA: serine/threonine-protein kinase, partial [Acidimicrobiales bacterium]|nr:serine/threonine-protein kinase [Acidimicrobiales bacterium]